MAHSHIKTKKGRLYVAAQGLTDCRCTHYSPEAPVCQKHQQVVVFGIEKLYSAQSFRIILGRIEIC